jgi:hypothetical protein
MMGIGFDNLYPWKRSRVVAGSDKIYSVNEVLRAWHMLNRVVGDPVAWVVVRREA